ncbi:MAG: hypothetical protein ACYC75_00045 [Minisyncoccota bacterium]
MSSILLFHHLGLGDHIMCHGIVREHCKMYARVAIFSKPHNYISVSFMYRDLQNITIIKGDDAFAKKFIFLNKFKMGKYRYDKIMILGHRYLNQTSNIPFERQFYQLANIDIGRKWNNFFIQRDPKREEALIGKVPLPKEYVFVHEDPARGFVIKRDYINKDYAIFTPNKNLTDNIFDYCAIISQAKEIHVIDSSFMFMIDCLSYENSDQKLFVHRYSRENPDWQLPILKKNWTIITE